VRADQDACDSPTNAAKEKELGEFTGSPGRFQFRTKHIETEHIKKDVEEATMKENVCYYLPQEVPLRHVGWRESKLADKRRRAGSLINERQEKRNDAGNDQSLYCRRPASTHSETSV